MLKILALCLAAAAAVALPAHAAVTVDQSSLPGAGITPTTYEADGFAPGPSSPPFGYGQSFTVGLAGRLDSLQLALINNGASPRALDLRLYHGVPGDLSQPALYSASISAPVFDIPLNVFTPWTALPTFDLRPANLLVSPGEVLTWVVSSQTQLDFHVGLVDSASGVAFTLAGGDKYQIGSGGSLGLVQPFGNDFAFRTFVADAAPEPTAWLLMLVGLGGLGARLRARRRTAVAA